MVISLDPRLCPPRLSLSRAQQRAGPPPGPIAGGDPSTAIRSTTGPRRVGARSRTDGTGNKGATSPYRAPDGPQRARKHTPGTRGVQGQSRAELVPPQRPHPHPPITQHTLGGRNVRGIRRAVVRGNSRTLARAPDSDRAGADDLASSPVASARAPGAQRVGGTLVAWTTCASRPAPAAPGVWSCPRASWGSASPTPRAPAARA